MVTGIIEPHARTLELPLLARAGAFSFFFCLNLSLRGQFSQCARPPIQEGNFGRLSARFNYSSPYGMAGGCVEAIHCAREKGVHKVGAKRR